MKRLKKIASLLMSLGILSILYCILVYPTRWLSEYYVVLNAKGNGTNYWSDTLTTPPNLKSAVFVFYNIMFFVLLISFFVRKRVHAKSIWKAAWVSGFIAFSITFLLIWFVFWDAGQWHNLFPISTQSFIIGFLFPILYRTFSKQPLFNEHFY